MSEHYKLFDITQNGRLWILARVNPYKIIEYYFPEELEEGKRRRDELNAEHEKKQQEIEDRRRRYQDERDRLP